MSFTYSTNLLKLEKPSNCAICDRERYRMPNGRPRCSHCDTMRAKKYHVKNHEKHKERVKNYYYKNKGDENTIYNSWFACNRRCHNPEDNAFRFYGKLGITVNRGWRYLETMSSDLSSEKFKNYRKYVLNTLGYRPSPEYTIDRIDVFGNYEPGNIRWANRNIQSRNTKRNKKYKGIAENSFLINYLNKNISLLTFIKITGLNSAVALKRYFECDDADWILHDKEQGRFFKYLNHLYTREELSLLSDYSQRTVNNRIEEGWTVLDIILVPEELSYKDIIKENPLPAEIEKHPIVYNNKEYNLKDFSIEINMPLEIVIYRYNLNQSAEEIKAQQYENQNRKYLYKGYHYTTTELAIIKKCSTGKINDRIYKRGWSVEDAMNIP